MTVGKKRADGPFLEAAWCRVHPRRFPCDCLSVVWTLDLTLPSRRVVEQRIQALRRAMTSPLERVRVTIDAHPRGGRRGGCLAVASLSARHGGAL